MNNLISPAVKAIEQCGYEPHIERDEVFFYAPETEYVFSIETKTSIDGLSTTHFK